MNQKNHSDAIKMEINHDIWRRSPWCYVKIQSLLELFLNKYLFLNFYVRDPRELTTKEKIDRAAQISKQQDFDMFYELNKKANDIKHNNEKVVAYDQEFLRKFYDQFNKYVRSVSLSKPDLADYYLDSTILNQDMSISRVSDKYEDSKDGSQRTFIQTDSIINCCVNKKDKCFKMHVKPRDSNLSAFHQSLFATIFNFLQRSSRPRKNRFIEYTEKELGVSVDYSRVYKYEMLLLYAIKNGYLSDWQLKLNAEKKDYETIKIAFHDIKNYAAMLSTLCKKSLNDISLLFDQTAPTISIDYPADIYTEDLSNKETFRSFWFASNLIYQIETPSQESSLNDLLYDFFGFFSFRPGQLEAVKCTLNNNSRSICVMPTGSGKSLVFYMNALLSACPTIIISPTVILAKDQQRNLEEIHNIDDCFVYSKDKRQDLQLNHKFIYLTPEDMQSYSLILKLIDYNTKNEIANVILDEIHTLCNWSHDFRPDYLMLCNNLFNFVDNCRYIGFTATANHKVLLDIVNQFKIKIANVFKPLDFNAGDFVFDFLACADKTQQIQKLLEVVENFVSNREKPDDKMIVFTRSLKDSKYISDELKKLNNYDTSWFDSEHTYSYEEFLSGRKHVLIADSEMGIGINLPDVVCVVHFGLPNSKAQYVQEIGRANRSLNCGKSIVIFTDNRNMSKEDSRIISFETSIDEIVNIMQSNSSELSSLFSSVLGTIESYNASSTGIIKLYDSLSEVDNFVVLEIRKKTAQDKLRIQKYLYKLHLLGIIDNWYFKYEDESVIRIQIEMNFSKDKLDGVKQKVISYLNSMGSFGKYTFELLEAHEIKEIVYIFEKWYYNEFLRYHREQLLSIIEFFNYYADNFSKSEILEELNCYFATTLQSMNDSHKYIQAISLEELLSSPNTVNAKLSNISEQLLATKYSVKLDLICFLYNYKRNSAETTSRLLRIIDNMERSERRSLLENMYRFYGEYPLESKLSIINRFMTYFSARDVISVIYNRTKMDEIYYGYLAREVNIVLEVY